ncbi:YopX family protein [Enterococcus faecalis]|uniref:YopX family protein n=1 Tax=Enterococcus faecalis TaxID=1351 RepID=UPI000A19666D|nr:YopX family protein [Enterococcus faecalis]EGO7913678.1 DNA-packaging protein [Enterococcus faecalis]EJY7270400.1 DNA-packaging protein [Enterococcus faecalis]MCU2218804.1 YopX family protein [Enterococcus faecalis]MDF4247918.1 YopX family protein [Enterococcus faecalis]UER66578.1 YopX family protein [Enterococcus faecalis]
MIPKFRAWDKRENTMRDVAVLHFTKGGKVNSIEYWKTPSELKSYHVRNLVLMQSTGLKDKNGVDVYQGDIIRCTRGCPHEVIWLEEYGGAFFGGMPAWYLSGLKKGYAWTGEEEVIGNIYENPELLEEKECLQVD